ncbi:GDSL-type esterase/lipase family protein [Pseudonocardia hydrocarbonoxydans]|uniref:SGNH hydrolase-type esterase domain-containing protein n=1 Tax=Pseudonocardia hydrocarbonoxydans TaxID=76726 RepID=A0A4Y3WUM0_9PSEU|nr:GDSL-type esterase/lipase family protein [Pseudonocardia hydrocarbonoxydans]GEC22587.1 hypothetical protein PHY01_48700 [Pseudonocardia hydrocarbonoxydans]
MSRGVVAARSWSTALAVALCVLVGVPLVVWLNPDQQVRIAGQSIGVGARDPQLTPVGPAQLVQIGNTELDLTGMQVYGPLRPRLSLGPVQRNAAAMQVFDPARTADVVSGASRTLVDALARWYLWGALGAVVVALAVSALTGCLRMLAVLRREGRRGNDAVPVADLWHACSASVRRTTVIAVAASVLAWGACGALAYAGTVRGLSGVASLADLTGATRVTPSPVGPVVTGYSGAVIGDSRVARLGGPPVADATAEDLGCRRSADSLAAELTGLLPAPVLNLACAGASIDRGLRGAQQLPGAVAPPQVGRLKQVQGLDFVVVAIGPNDLHWSDFLLYCYGLATCDDRLTSGEFDYRLAAFDQDYAALLQDLNDLPGAPQVIVMTSYDAFAPGADAECPDARGPDGVPGLDPPKIALLAQRNAQLNAVLEAGAQQYGFTVARPRITSLCGPGTDGLGRDLQGLADPDPFHPTGIGSLRLAATVARLVDRVPAARLVEAGS